MVRGIVVLGGNSHPGLVQNIANILGLPPCNRMLSKFSGGETRCEIQDSVRGKDVYIIQTGSGQVNDHLIELCIMISACKIGSAKRITAVLPLFPYSRQPDVPYNKTGAPHSQRAGSSRDSYTESIPPTPGVNSYQSSPFHNTTATNGANGADGTNGVIKSNGINGTHGTNGPNGVNSVSRTLSEATLREKPPLNNVVSGSSYVQSPKYTTHDYENQNNVNTFTSRPGYKQWVAQAGTLVADLLTESGADHVISLELHDPQYQGFLDCPFDNLYGKPTLQRYITESIPEWRDAVIVSPDAGGAKRATSIADALGLDFSLIHKERRPTKYTERRNATMMLVGDVRNRVCILVDDIIDTGTTITRAAKLLNREGATKIYALLTHGVFSGDAIGRINDSPIDKIVVTNSVPQDDHRRLCSKLEVLDISPILAEAIRRSHHGESISVLFQY